MDAENITQMRRRSPMPNVGGTLPHCTEIELSLLAAIVADAGAKNGAIRAALESGIEPKHFASDDHGRLYAICVELWAEGTPPILPLIHDALVQRLALDETLRLDALLSKAASDAYPEHVPHFTRRILDTWRQRRIIHLSGELAGVAYAFPVDFVQIAALRDELSTLSVPSEDRLSNLVISLEALAMQDLPDLHFVVLPILPAGLTILGGRPKMGKSWMALNIALSVASGSGAALGRFTSCESGRVLYLALEDTKRRLVDRARMCSGDSPLPERLDVATDWPRLDVGGLALIEQWLRQHEDRKLVICDTLAMIRAEAKEQDNANLYTADYAAVRELKQLADRYDVAILVVHHLRKSASLNGDPIEELSGTYGLSGAADTVLVLKREHNDSEGTLQGRGRDTPDIDWSMRFDQGTGIWTSYGDASTRRLTENQREVIDLLKQSGRLSPRQVCNILPGKGYEAVKKLMQRMAQGHLLEPHPDGKYSALEAGQGHGDMAGTWGGVPGDGDTGT